MNKYTKTISSKCLLAWKSGQLEMQQHGMAARIAK
jgi:hypothetical protein